MTVFTVVLSLVLGLAVIYLMWGIVHCPSSQILVKHNRLAKWLGNDPRPEFYRNGPVFMVPFVETYDFVELGPRQVSVDLERVLGKGDLNPPSEYHVKVALEASDPDELREFWEQNERELEEQTKELLVSFIPEEDASYINEHRNEFLVRWEQAMKENLEDRNFQYLSLSHLE